MRRRAFLQTLPFATLAARVRSTIRDIQTMVVQGPRTYTLVKVINDAGLFGLGEAYGSPGVGVKEQIHALKPELIGKDALGIDAIWQNLGQRTDGSAHSLLRAASGIEMALWDLAGKTLNVPVYALLGGKFRDKVKLYDHAAPKDVFDPASCREWAERVKANPAGFRAHKFSPPRAREDASNRQLSTRELLRIRKAYENCREAIGWDHDLMVHCHWEYDLRTSIQLAEAVASIKPMWLEDPLPPDYSDSWKRLCAASPVPICMGENLARRQQFKDFIVNQACDILHPDLRNSGGFLETKRIADMADSWGLPVATHNTGSIVATLANVAWAASIRDFIHIETVMGKGDWLDKMVLYDGPIFREGSIAVSDKPGIGVDLNPDVVRAHLATGEAWWG